MVVQKRSEGEFKLGKKKGGWGLINGVENFLDGRKSLPKNTFQSSAGYIYVEILSLHDFKNDLIPVFIY